jgi:ribosomal protein L29
MKRRGEIGKRAALIALLAVSLSSGLCAQNAPIASTQKNASVTSDEKPIVLDRVIAIINGDVLLESDVREEMRLAALQPITVPTGQNTSLRAARRLIARALILRQMKEQHQINYSVTDDEVKKSLMELRTQIPICRSFHCTTEEGWLALLKADGLTEQETNDLWRQRLEILKFIQARFGPGIRIPHQDIEKYHQTNVVPAFEKLKEKPPPLDSTTPRIREILLQQQVNLLLHDWLKSLREQGSVQVLDPTYAEIAPKETEDDDSGGGA